MHKEYEIDRVLNERAARIPSEHYDAYFDGRSAALGDYFDAISQITDRTINQAEHDANMRPYWERQAILYDAWRAYYAQKAVARRRFYLRMIVLIRRYTDGVAIRA